MKAAAAPQAEAKVSTWGYQNSVDKMTGKSVKTASLTSTQSMSLEFPYQGNNYAQIEVRKNKSNTDEVLFSFEKGQSLCKNYGDPCRVMVRFDDAQPVAYGGHGPSDGSSNYVFLSPAAKFAADAKKAKKIKVSLDIYNNGTQILEFTTATPLNW